MKLAFKIIWSIGFLIGTTTHSLDLYRGGWLPYEFMPLPFNIYWTSLTFLDPAAAIMIWWQKSWAIVLGCLIMGSNVIVNGYTAFIAGYEEFYLSLALQTVFAGFVFYASYSARKSAPSR